MPPKAILCIGEVGEIVSELFYKENFLEFFSLRKSYGMTSPTSPFCRFYFSNSSEFSSFWERSIGKNDMPLM